MLVCYRVNRHERTQAIPYNVVHKKFLGTCRAGAPVLILCRCHELPCHSSSGACRSASAASSRRISRKCRRRDRGGHIHEADNMAPTPPSEACLLPEPSVSCHSCSILPLGKAMPCQDCRAIGSARQHSSAPRNTRRPGRLHLLRMRRVHIR